MGISRLTRDLASYAEHIQVGRSSEDNIDGSRPSEKLVIDGPSLVYHVYNSALVSKASTSAVTINAHPTYQDVNEAVKAYLLTLEKHGIQV